jgi:hypothetical protein
MPDKYLNIVAFDIPYPPNYGGVIDVWYKLKYLHRKGVRIILHCFEYPGRDRKEELNQICEEVHYYPRLLGIRSALSLKPYIVTSRRSEELVGNLLKNDYPILFEGLHSCYYIGDKRLKNRNLIYREVNIEHWYYFSLFNAEKNLFKKLYFLSASLKLRLYQKVLRHACLILAVSHKDTEYLQQKFPGKKVEFIPCFHVSEAIESLSGTGDYALYNGNIEVPENACAVRFLVEKIFNDLPYKFIIAGMNPPPGIQKLVSRKPNVELVANPDDKTMFDLIRKAHINILVTFQATGLKLKLLNTLYKGRFCLVNDKMLNGTGLNGLCEIGNTPAELKSGLRKLFDKEFKAEELIRREEILNRYYSNDANAAKMISLIFLNHDQ